MNNWKIRLYRIYSSKLCYFQYFPLSRTLGNKLSNFAKKSIILETEEVKTFKLNGGEIKATTEDFVKPYLSENPYFLHMKDQMYEGDVFVDIGGARGFYSALAALEGLKAHYIECDNFFITEATENFHLNSVSKKITIHNTLAGKEDTDYETRIDSLELGDPDIIKIDVDGGEMNVLKGAKHTLEKGVELYVECHTDALYSESKDFLDELGYREEKLWRRGKDRLVYFSQDST